MMLLVIVQFQPTDSAIIACCSHSGAAAECKTEEVCQADGKQTARGASQHEQTATNTAAGMSLHCHTGQQRSKIRMTDLNFTFIILLMHACY